MPSFLYVPIRRTTSGRPTAFTYTVCLLLAIAFTNCSSRGAGRLEAPITNGTEDVRPPQRRNVVLLLADDQGAHLSALGTPGISTPNVDRLAERGVLFTRAYAAVPSCSPSRSSINTGMYPHANGHWRNTITPELDDPDSDFTRAGRRIDKVGIHEYIRTLPEVMRAAGYFTAITQKFHMSPPWKFPYSARDAVQFEPTGFRRAATEFLDEAGEQPFFFQVNISPPHRPLQAALADHPEMLPHPDSIEIPADYPDIPKVREDWRNYYGGVQLADACAGAVLDLLRERGLLENTLIIYTGDQGQAFHRAKASAYRAGLHVPLVVSGPGVAAGRTENGLVSLIDLMPTILTFTGLDVPETVQGRPLGDLLNEDRSDDRPRPYVFGEANSHGPARPEHYPVRMVSDGRYYYLRNLLPEKTYLLPADLREEKGWGNLTYGAIVAAQTEHPLPYRLLRTLESGRPPEELYDLATDPYQMTNRIDDPALESVRRELSDRLDEWRTETGDTTDDPKDIPTRLPTKK